MQFTLRVLPISKLLLDPNNYRFLDSGDWQARQQRRFHEDTVQNATLRLMEHGSRYQLAELRKSILSNGYVPLERLMVVPYQYGSDMYLVVEGNRRVAALKTLLRDHEDGSLTLSDEQKGDFSRIPVAILQEQGAARLRAERIIMGIRHIAGPREWGAYQQAHFILELHESEGQDFNAIADHLGLSRIETARRYRAMRALKAMENDEQHAGCAKPEFYRLFHEMVSIPDVREYFRWDHEEAKFIDEEKARQFFGLIASEDPDLEPKLRTYLDVRRLRGIIGNKAAEAALFDPDETFAAVLRIARAGTESERAPVDLAGEIKKFMNVLENLGIDALKTLNEEDIAALESLIDLVSQRIADYKALSQEDV